MKILFATDGSPDAGHALNLLTLLNGLSDAEITVVSVVQHFIFLTGRIDGDMEQYKNALLDSETRAAEEIVHETAKRLNPYFKRVETRVHCGFITSEILKAGGEIGADLIVLGGKGRSRLAEWFLGSVSRSVLEQAACSVLIGRSDPNELSQALLAYDGSMEAEAGLRWIEQWTDSRSLQIEVVSIAEPILLPAAGFNVALPVEYAPTAAGLQEMACKTMEQNAQRACRTLQEKGFDTGIHTLSGDPTEKIVQAADECGADLIVMGAHARRGWFQDLVGNTTRGVLQRTRRSVLIARSGIALPYDWLSTIETTALKEGAELEEAASESFSPSTPFEEAPLEGTDENPELIAAPH